MKNGMKLGLVAVALMSVSAFADFRPGRVRPISKIQLEQIEGDGRYPLPVELTVNKQDGATGVAGFTLLEDKGLRCVTTPCPSHQTTQFHVTNVSKSRAGSIVYTASTDRPFIMGIIVPRPGHVTRTIEVSDHTNNKLARHKFPWILKIKGLHDIHTYGGHAEPVYTTQSVGGSNVE